MLALFASALANSLLLADPSEVTVPIDIDHDGAVEIARIDEYVKPQGVVPDAAPVFVLVESRLAELSKKQAGDPLHAAMATYASDLVREGFWPKVEVVDCPPAPAHQDGKYVLAFRALFRAERTANPNFAGAVFVGHFPDAMLVRTVAWQRNDAFTLRAGTKDEAKYPQGTPWIRNVPELIAHRADIVLADLDGDWEGVYTQPRTAVPSVCGAFPKRIPPGGGGLAADAEWSAIDYEDFFHVADGHATKSDAGTVFLPPTEGSNLECSAADRGRPNAMAVPDICISRIDARGVALQPVADLLDEKGHPKAGLQGKATPQGWIGAAWHHDDALELKLMIEFFDRNHRYRTGALNPSFVPASLECGLGSGFDVVRSASPKWASLDAKGLDVGGSPDLVAVAHWLQNDSVLRTIRAHSDPWGSAFAAPDLKALADYAGPAWAFDVKDGEFTPSLDRACRGGKLDFFLLRTLYENRHRDGACFYVHTGCESISPAGADRLPWSDPGYGGMNGAEAVLFYGNGLALVGRAKVFYDEPRGFCESLGEGKTFGDAWRRYFELESAAKTWGEVGDDIGRKRAYFWSVLGDFTLRLRQG